MKKIFCLVLMIFLGISLSFAATEQEIDNAMAQYYKTIQENIKKNIQYNSTESTDAIVSYEITPEGNIVNIRIDKSGGDAYDKALITAIQKSSPYKPYPEGANFSSVTLQSQFKHIVQKTQEYHIGLIPQTPTSQEDMAIKEYNNKVSQIVYDKMPTYFGYLPQEAKIEIKIHSDGTVKYVNLIMSSGIEEYDKKIIDTCSKLKFPPFSQELSRLQDLKFSFVLYRNMKSAPLNNVRIFR